MSEVFTQFHFLRPLFLLGLLALPVLVWLLQQKRDEGNDWSNAIDPTLLAHLMPASKKTANKRSNLALISAVVLILVSLSGPTWERKPQPVAQIKDDIVVVLDLSISMLATDIAPDRLTRAKQKLQDLLALRDEGNTALIAFSGDAHIVTPLSDDSNTLLANLPALDPFMMPIIGSRPDLAIQQAVDLLERGNAKRGRIVLVTDGVEPHQAERINDTLPSDRYTLSVLAVGTAPGAPIDLGERGYLKDDGNVVIPKTDLKSLRQLANNNGGQFSEISLTDKDLNRLDIDGSRFLNAIKEEDDSAIDKRFDAWEDLGYWLLLAIIPLLMLSHRQGAFLLVLLIVWPNEEVLAAASDNPQPNTENIPLSSFWDDLWATRDQQAQALMNQGRYDEAANVFESPEHKAEALYRAGKFEEASSSIPNESSSRSAYNRGNALANSQQFEEAIKSYEAALDADPNNDDARFNKKIVEEALAEQEKQQQDQQNQDQNGDQQDDQSGDQKGDQDKEQGDDQKGDESSDSESENNGQSGDQDGDSKQSNEQASDQSEESQEQKNQNEASDKDGQDDQNASEQTSEQSEQASDSDASALSRANELDQLSDEEKQSFEQWMRRVPDDPGALLRRKFEQRSRERNQQEREKGEPLW